MTRHKMNKLSCFGRGKTIWRHRAAGYVFNGIYINFNTVVGVSCLFKSIIHCSNKVFFKTDFHFFKSEYFEFVTILFKLFQHPFVEVIFMDTKCAIIFKKTFVKGRSEERRVGKDGRCPGSREEWRERHECP